MSRLVLVSHKLCPYVQRAAIVLHEKGVPFERRWVDLADKPDWFRAVSPLGKTPVLLVDGEPVFESAVICEYLDEVHAPRLHPADPLQRARHRAWMEFGSAVLNTIAAFYGAVDARVLDAKREELRARFAQLEAVLDARGPYFAGAAFSMVDAVFAPVFRYFEVFGALGVDGFFDGLPKVRAWRDALAQRESVQLAASDDYAQLLTQFLIGRGSEVSRRIAPALSAAARSPA
ncbi:glutathione S-transferase family protein [Ramlibacter sp. PS4R-6]|uniref:glutathione S-transferase family protein n=1 Tax=Ramlibacter sp. PS4R-6 TaxID=3133438 RepID=UPI00309A5B2B